MTTDSKELEVLFEGDQFPVILSDWIRDQKNVFGENAFYHPNSEYFKVLEEISLHESEFIANTIDLTDKAAKYSTIYNQLNADDKRFVTELLQEEIFSFSYVDEEE